MDGDEIQVIDDEIVDDDPVEIPENEEPEEEKPFLKVNERTVYKTPEEAIKGFENANERLGQYRELGSPEEIRAERARYAELDRITGRAKGTSENMDDPLHGLSDDQKAEWKAWWSRGDKQIRAGGYIHESELPDRIEAVVEARERRNTTRNEFAELAKQRGIEVDEDYLASMEQAAGFLASAEKAKTSEFSRELNRLYFQPGGQKEFAKRLFDRLYGKAPAKQKAETEPKPDPKVRDANGRFEATKRKTQDLPKTPTSRTPGVEQKADDDLSKITDPKERSRVRAQRRLQEAREMVAQNLAS